MGVEIGDSVQAKLSGETRDKVSDSAGSKLDDAAGAKLGDGIKDQLCGQMQAKLGDEPS